MHFESVSGKIRGNTLRFVNGHGLPYFGQPRLTTNLFHLPVEIVATSKI
jgi:hypothetical protein